MSALPPPDQSIRRWRLWASVAVVGFVLLAAMVGFLVISSRGEDGVAGAIGIAHHQAAPAPATAASAVPPPTNVAWTTSTLAAIAAGDPGTGRAIALQSCAGCHGETGVATAPAFPNLAGQHATALYKQLRDYADGNRDSPIMAGIAGTLDDAAMMDLAAYFSGATAIAHARPRTVPGGITELVANGDAARGLPPCGSCHAPRGGPQGIPLLDGQPTAYLQQQLEAFASNARGNDIYGVMRTIAGMLTSAEIEGLAAYYGN